MMLSSADHAFSVVSKNSSPNPRSPRSSLTLSSRSNMPAFYTETQDPLWVNLAHLELISGYTDRCAGVPALCVAGYLCSVCPLVGDLLTLLTGLSGSILFHRSSCLFSPSITLCWSRHPFWLTLKSGVSVFQPRSVLLYCVNLLWGFHLYVNSKAVSQHHRAICWTLEWNCVNP